MASLKREALTSFLHWLVCKNPCKICGIHYQHVVQTWYFFHVPIETSRLLLVNLIVYGSQYAIVFLKCTKSVCMLGA